MRTQEVSILLRPSGSTKTQVPLKQLTMCCPRFLTTGLWRNGSASDSRSEGWEFESLWPHTDIPHTASGDRANFKCVLDVRHL
jgi:hypothetical protein